MAITWPFLTKSPLSKFILLILPAYLKANTVFCVGEICAGKSMLKFSSCIEFISWIFTGLIISSSASFLQAVKIKYKKK